MDRQRQTIELLQLLGDDVAQSVLAQLPPEHAARLQASIRRPPTEILLRPRKQRELLDNFEEFFQFALKAAPPRPVLFDSEDLPEAADDSAADITPPAPEPAAPATPEPPPLTGDPLLDLQHLSVNQLAQAIESEQPRTTAILLSHLPAQVAADALSLLPDDYRRRVTRELSREQHAPPILVERIARATLQRGLTLSPQPPDRRPHADRLADLLRSVPRPQRMGMLAAIAEEDEELNKTLLKRMYRFEDLATLEPRMIQRILGEIDATTVTTALFGAAAEVREAILGNLSRRARQSIEEELNFQTHVAESRVTQAREAIAEAIAKIDQESE